ncbi:MAG: GNAT family N-acetyltransferase [Natrinema limicola]
MTETYTVRPFQQGDLDQYLSLYHSVFGTRPDEKWFQWKYLDNPYIDHVPIYVAETDSEIVGARSFFALPLRTTRETVLALQPCDTMVYEAHRRRGLFMRMTKVAIERYRDDVPEIFFNFPNSKTRTGNRKLGWKVVQEKEILYRLQNPAAIAKSAGDGRVMSLASSAASPALTGYVTARDHLANNTQLGGTIERHERVPTERLASLYYTAVPDAFHVVRNERFLQWRFRNPEWEYTTYIAIVGGDDIAAIVTGSQTTGGITKTTIIDVLPRGDTEAAVSDGLLSAVLDYNQETDLIVAMGESIDREILLKRGFLPDSKPPLSPVTETTTLMVRSLSDDEILDGKAITEAKNWQTTFLSHDTD